MKILEIERLQKRVMKIKKEYPKYNSETDRFVRVLSEIKIDEILKEVESDDHSQYDKHDI